MGGHPVRQANRASKRGGRSAVVIRDPLWQLGDMFVDPHCICNATLEAENYMPASDEQERQLIETHKARQSLPRRFGLHLRRALTLSETHKARQSLPRLLAWPVIVLTLCVAVWAMMFWQLHHNPEPPKPPDAQQPQIKLSQNFFDARILPMEQENQKANREAADRCIARITEKFNKYRAGVKGFAEDVTGIVTRFGVLRRMPSNWWYKHDSITPYINRRFKKYIFSEEQLKKDLESELTAFRDDLRANRGALLSGVKVAISESMLSHREMPDSEAFDHQVVQDQMDYAARRAKDSVYTGLLSLITSEIATVAVTEMVTQFMATFATTAATEAAVAGGATAGGLAAGGTGGTALGPGGIVIGAGVGLVVGFFVDWWLNDSFKAKLSEGLDDYIVRLRDGIIEGTTYKGVQRNPGLRNSLSQYCDDLNTAQTSILHEHVVGEIK